MAESLNMALTQTLKRYVCEEVTEGDLNDNKLSNPSQDKPSQEAGKSSSPSEQMSRSVTFCLMPKNMAMESNTKSTNQLETSLKPFKLT